MAVETIARPTKMNRISCATFTAINFLCATLSDKMNPANISCQQLTDYFLVCTLEKSLGSNTYWNKKGYRIPFREQLKQTFEQFQKQSYVCINKKNDEATP